MCEINDYKKNERNKQEETYFSNFVCSSTLGFDFV